MMLIGAAIPAAGGASAPIEEIRSMDALAIGSRLEPFIDPYLIETLDGVELRMATPVDRETVLRFDLPWEGRYCGYCTVLQDGDLFRLYYRGLPVAGKDGSQAEVTCYAESRDGIHWSKPDLGFFEVDGTRENNVVLVGMAPLSHNFSPFLDARPGVPPHERFKAVGGVASSGLVGFVSPDGLRWKKIREEPILTRGAFDSQNVVFWSPTEECYCCYFRTFQGKIRRISRCTSPDFLHWGESVLMEYGDAPIEQLYTNQTRPYFRAPHLYVAIAARFMSGRRVLSSEQARAVGVELDYSGDCSDTVLLSSRGGDQYARTFMEGFVRPGVGASNWSSRTNYPACGLIPTGPAEMSFYVQRDYGQPSHHLQRLTLRTDGFASIHAPYAGGIFVTKPLTFTGTDLAINYATSAAGGVRVALLDLNGRPIEGYTSPELIGDEVHRVISWEGAPDLSSLEGTPIRLRFQMMDGDLYSIQFQ